MTEDRRQRSEDRGRRSEVGGQRTDYRGQTTEAFEFRIGNAEGGMDRGMRGQIQVNRG